MKTTILAAMLLLPAPALAQLATFDSFPEGSPTKLFADAGITFSDLDQRLPGSPPPNNFVFEDASSTLAGMPGFSPPMTLGFGGYSPGPGAAFSRCGEFTITPPSPSASATVEVFYAGNTSGNKINLEAFSGGAPVAIDSHTIMPGFGPHHVQLEIAGATFDKLLFHITGSDPVFFGIVDDVHIEQGTVCYADCDDNGTLNIDDFLCFQLEFALAYPYADCDGNQVLNIDDFLCFQLAFALGC